MEDSTGHLKIHLRGMGEDCRINKYELYHYIENIIVSDELSERITEEIWNSKILSEGINLDINELYNYIIKYDKKKAVRFKNVYKYKTGVASGKIKNPLIIIIGGCAGSGKTTIAIELSRRLGLKYVGGGFTRDILQICIPQKLFPIMYEHTYTAYKATNNPFISKNRVLYSYIEQSTIMSNCINMLIDKATIQGTHLILEGGFILPQILKLNRHILHFIQAIQNDKLIIQRIKSTLTSTHLKRPIQKDDILNVSRINDYLIKSALENDVNVVFNDGTIEDTLNTVLDLLAEKINEIV